ncbi:hypothetical protein RFI_26360, partial [Reticulomyxa filosa]
YLNVLKLIMSEFVNNSENVETAKSMDSITYAKYLLNDLKAKNEKVVISSFSLEFALVIAAAGAREQTRERVFLPEAKLLQKFGTRGRAEERYWWESDATNEDTETNMETSKTNFGEENEAIRFNDPKSTMMKKEANFDNYQSTLDQLQFIYVYIYIYMFIYCICICIYIFFAKSNGYKKKMHKKKKFMLLKKEYLEKIESFTQSCQNKNCNL